MRWRSMKTAPKDGTRFVAAFAPDANQHRSWQEPAIVIEWMDEEACWWTGGCLRYLDHEFTGWVPLPS